MYSCTDKVGTAFLVPYIKAFKDYKLKKKKEEEES
jgi:hypothetical protein